LVLGSTRSHSIFRLCNHNNSTCCVENYVLGYIPTLRLPTTRRIIGRLFLKPSALPYPLPIQACRPHIGRHSRYSCCRRHPKQPCLPECSMHAAACQILFCLRNLGEAPSATSLIGLILPCGGP